MEIANKLSKDKIHDIHKRYTKYIHIFTIENIKNTSTLE